MTQSLSQATTAPAASAAHVPPALLASLERQLGATITDIVPRAGNGASRQGAEVGIDYPDGQSRRGYLSFDTRTADPRRLPMFEREVAILSALSGPLAHRGVSAPPLLASDKDHLALLTGLVPGKDNFDRAMPAEERRATEYEAVGQIARLHGIDATTVRLDGFGDPTVPNAQRIAARIAELRADNLASAPDPLLLLALDWLECNIPADNGPSVIVHGDAGPGNFLHQDGHVTALLDWELAHFGDPMEDLAQMWVRAMFNPFMGPAEMFSAYERAGGVQIDVARVRYHRLYFQIGFMVANHANLHGHEAVPTALIGTTLLFEAAHFYVVARSLSELSGIALDDVPMVDSLPGIADRSYALALEDIRTVIAPRATDQQARAKATSLARLVKYWRNRDRFGPYCDQAEMVAIADALNEQVASVQDARHRLAIAIAEKRIDFATALQLCHRRAVYQTELMGEAMGSLRYCYFKPYHGK